MASQRLYKATFTFDLYVLARDPDEARGVASRNAVRELDQRSPYTAIEGLDEVVDARSIDADWVDSPPYATPGAEHEGSTCGEALKAINAERRRADLPGQRKLFGEER